MRIVTGMPVTDRSYEERGTVANIRLCFSYTHTDAPLDGSNNFARALHEHVSRVPGFTIVDDLNGDYDVLFMNQLSRSPEVPTPFQKSGNCPRFS